MRHSICFRWCRISAFSSIAGTPFLVSVCVAPCFKTLSDKGIQRNVRGWQFRKLLEVRRSCLQVLVLIPCFTPEQAVYQRSMVRQANSNTALNYCTFRIYFSVTKGVARLRMPLMLALFAEACWSNLRNETLMASIKVLHACAGKPQRKHAENVLADLCAADQVVLRYHVSQVIHSCAWISTGAFRQRLHKCARETIEGVSSYLVHSANSVYWLVRANWFNASLQREQEDVLIITNAIWDALPRASRYPISFIQYLGTKAP